MAIHFNKPLVLLSGFKAGTWLMRKILTEMTGLPWIEPDITPTRDQYRNRKNFFIRQGYYYSWHFEPDEQTIDYMITNDVKAIFLMRNIYDVVVSIYFHFFNNIDADIGRGTNNHHFLKKFSTDVGFSLIITGYSQPGYFWEGIWGCLRQYNAMANAALKGDFLTLNYDELVLDKLNILKKISNYLELDIPTDTLNLIVEKTSFNKMKADAQKKGKGIAHFRKGTPQKNRTLLKDWHIIQVNHIINLWFPDLREKLNKLGMKDIVTY